MTSGFGVDPTYNAAGTAVTSSTTAQDIRKVFGGLYSPGLVSGGVITTSSSAMTFSVSAGVAIIPVSTGENIAAPFDSATVATAAAPTSGSRTDIVYVLQHFPAAGDSNVVIGVGTVLPANAVAIGSYVIGANSTNTNAAVKTGNVNYSIPYGAGSKILWQWTDTYSGVHGQDMYRAGLGNIYLPTDRLLRFSVTSLLYADGAVGFDNSHYVEWATNPELDNQPLTSWRSPGLHQAWATYMWEGYYPVTAGSHTVSYTRGRITGPGSAATKYGPSGQGWNWPGTVFTVEDAGVVT